MLVTGYQIERCNGWYFTTLSDIAGQPKALGRQCADQIPVRRENYEIWLAERRESCTSRARQWEDDKLYWSRERMKHDPKLIHTAASCTDHDQKHVGPFQHPPSELVFAARFECPNWVYVIDLDDEILHVKNFGPYGEIYFDLRNMPTADWIHCFRDYQFDFSNCPQASPMKQGLERFRKISEMRPSSTSMLDSYRQTRVVPLSQKIQIHQILGLMLFDNLTAFTFQQWWKHVPEHRPSHFAYREMAYVVLCLATDQFHMDTHWLYYANSFGCEDCGYTIARAKSSEPRMLPHFGTKHHTDDRKPGAAPHDCTLYWFHNVLVSLVSDDVFAENGARLDEEIAKALQFGSSAQTQGFFVLLFSIRHAILLEYVVNQATASIRRTEIITIYNGSPSNSNDRRSEQDSSILDLAFRRSGFRALQNFFEIAGMRQRQYARDVLPYEIYSQVLKHMDPPTKKSCRNLSPAFYGLCQSTHYFSLSVTIFDGQADHPIEDLAIASSFGHANFTDTISGQRVASSFSIYSRPRESTHLSKSDYPSRHTWIPVFGRGDRLVLLPQLGFHVASILSE